MNLFSKNKEIIVNITNLGKYINFEFVDLHSNINEISNIYNNILKFLLSDLKLIYIGQLFDEDQGLAITKDQLEKIQEEFNLQLYITSNFSEYDDIGEYTNSYVINLAGKPIPYWLEKVTFWGGACLSNIIFGFSDKELIGLDEIVELNYKFSISYWYVKNYEKIASLRNNSAILCWTSDSNLNTLIDSQLYASLRDYLDKLEKIFSIGFTIKNNGEIYV